MGLEVMEMGMEGRNNQQIGKYFFLSQDKIT